MEDDPLAGHPVLRTVRVLGRSGSNVVVLASNVATGQLVAVKLIPRGFDSRQAKYLLRELLNHYELSLAKHPHIASLLDCFLTPRHIALVLEYVDGENLQVFLEKAGGCIIEPLARFLFQQLVIALDFCHRKGKINRNIKPSSLLLQLSDSSLPLLRMVDFSVCKDTLRHSEPRSQVGTAMYCAPEVLQDFRGAVYEGAAADMWSVGVVLFMMLFGRHPFSRPEDASLPAQQQVIAMFKRVTAPAGSYDGDLYVPHILPTSVLPGAQPGAPLSLPAADMLRGLLARDPKARMTLHGVQLHEWFRTGLPEGAALLNEVVAAEEAAAGPAAVMPPAVAVQMERMVLAAAAGPAVPPPGTPPPLVEGGRSGSGGAGDGGGSGNGPVRGPGVSGGGAARGPVSYAPQTPPPSQQQPQTPQHPAAQGPAVVRTITTTSAAGSDAAQSVSIGSAVAGAAAAQPGGGGRPRGVTATVTAAGADAAGPSLVSPVWSPVASVAGGAGDGDGDTGDLFADLEAMVMGIPDDGIFAAASLDFMMCASAAQQQQQQQQQQPTRQHPQQQQQHLQQHPHHPQHPQLSCSSIAMPGGSSAPVSADTAGTYAVPSPPQPQPHPPQSFSPTPAAEYSPCNLRQQHHHPQNPQHPHHLRAQQPSDGGSTAPRESDVGGGVAAAAHHAVPQTLAELLARGGGGGEAGSAAAPAADGPYGPTAGPSPPAAPAGPQLYTSLHSAAAAAPPSLDVNSGLMLMRLNTESLPSPTTLAVVDAHPFLAAQPSLTGLSGIFSSLRDPSLATIPSTYSMDWCTLSARSETLLSPKFAGAGGGGGGGGNGPSAGTAASLLQSSLWHKICNGCSDARSTLSGLASEARELGKAAISGLAGR